MTLLVFTATALDVIIWTKNNILEHGIQYWVSYFRFSIFDWVEVFPDVIFRNRNSLTVKRLGFLVLRLRSLRPPAPLVPDTTLAMMAITEAWTARAATIYELSSIIQILVLSKVEVLALFVRSPPCLNLVINI